MPVLASIGLPLVQLLLTFAGAAVFGRSREESGTSRDLSREGRGVRSAVEDRPAADRTATGDNPAGEPEATDRGHLRSVLQYLPFAVVVAEAPNGRIIFSNEQADHIYGRPLRHLESLDDYGSPGAFQRHGGPYRVEDYPIVRALHGDAVDGEEMEIVRGDGSRCPVVVSAAPIRNAERQIVAAVAAFYDVTEKRREQRQHDQLAERQRAARAQAEAGQRRWALLAEISQFLLASLDYQAAIAGLARLVLPSLGDACFIDIEDGEQSRRAAITHVQSQKAALLHTLDRLGGLTGLVGSALTTAVRTGKPSRGNLVEAGLPRAGTGDPERDERAHIVGVIRPRAFMVIPLVTRGRVLGAMVFLVTESDRRFSVEDLDFAQHVARRAATAVDNLRLYEEARQARLAAEDANRLKDEFLATLSHELRTPLNAILGWARMLRNRALDTAARDKALLTIERNALAQAQIVEDLLDVSRVITGSLRLDLQPADVAALVEAAITAIRPAAEAKGIQIRSHVERMQPLLADANRLQQVIWNLLSNATKFTGTGGRIDVTAERHGAEVALRVSDNGIGISPQFLPYVFERFRQADSTTTRTHGGLGLGLAIVRHLVELHGGTVEAESAGVGNGATFTVRLPVRPAANSPEDRNRSAAGVSRQPEGARPLLAGVGVLVVDDEPDARDLFASILRQQGATVRTAASTAEALETMQSFVPALLVADIAMPGEDGYSLIRRMRVDHPGVPAIAVTAYARPEDRRRALDAGFEMHLPKPVEPDELIGAVLDLCGRSSPWNRE